CQRLSGSHRNKAFAWLYSFLQTKEATSTLRYTWTQHFRGTIRPGLHPSCAPEPIGKIRCYGDTPVALVACVLLDKTRVPRLLPYYASPLPQSYNKPGSP
ncbi:hypothetical protein L916_02281, partial [Phytophthora nicotianae]